ncbi:carboxypeptidase-like regulatory domain-containing protein [Dokdonia sinensis]|uniref:Carboxypeptidase-like regulatory domain-containing protein n=1 Tax=Dokdonia sinensis TaxID=2479847 RepID=A0A3M0FV33_9FLAO|nr:DUF5686 and carboxypeptidase-like regulatory domain-containing protein [Dokdonia sinensis]RMB56650.1 carboxypeptidase-like regulatory domain-containing protein [Dokdonia sinensis]
MRTKLYFLFLLLPVVALAQTKVSGLVKDENGESVPFANVLFVNSNEGTITNEDGRFYLESDETWSTLRVSFIGFETQDIELDQKVNYKMEIVLGSGAEAMSEVVIFSGKTSKDEAENPAIKMLRKIWANKRENGLRQFKQYKYDKYEKLQFDLNTIDSALINSKLFKGMEFIFDQTDTSRVTGKTYLPIFVNEAFSKVYGDNVINKEKEILEGNKNSGFSENQTIITFVKDLYNDYDVYSNYLQFFDKSFTSPISRTGIQTYNYVLADSTFIDNKWCYNIIYYPRRKNELTFKGDFWVNDTTWAIKEINMQLSKSANINWVKEIYMEQEFDIVNDSTFLLARDYFLSDFSFRKKEESRGMYGKRTTLYENYDFDKELDKDFYDREVYNYDKDVYNRDDAFWEENRLESLSKDEAGVYKMLDTLKTVKKFKNLYNAGSILASGYWEIPSLNFDYGPIFSTFGFNDVEGLRIRTGGRTYFGQNDLWRLEGFLAYGFKDKKGKFGLSGKWLVDKKSRLIFSGGYRQDVEQIGASLTTSRDVLGRNLASSSLVNTAVNDKLTSIKLANVAVEIEPIQNLKFRTDLSLRELASASPTFSLDYFTDEAMTTTTGELKQAEVVFTTIWEPGKKTSGFGVERRTANEWFPTFFVSYTRGLEGTLDSDFEYDKLQFSFKKSTRLGGFGQLSISTEVGKIFDEVPLALLSPVPGNQSLFSIFNTYSQLNFYEFVTDEYASVQLEHNFGGRIFNRIPLLKGLNLREIIGIRGVIGNISQGNIDLNRPAFEDLLFEDGMMPTAITPNLIAPSSEPYYEYSFGVGNIFKVFRIDLNIRGNYNFLPDARKVGVTGSFGFYF